MARHGRREDHVARSLLPEDLTSNASTVVGTGEVHVHHSLPVLQLVIQATGLRRDTGIRNHHVQPAEVAHHSVSSSLNLQETQLSGIW